MGLYTDRPKTDLPLRELCQTILRISSVSDFSALQFGDDSGGGLRRYNVYRVTANGQAYVLKSSEWREVNVYLNFLSKHSFHTPKFYGSTFYDHRSGWQSPKLPLLWGTRRYWPRCHKSQDSPHWQ